MKAIRHILLAVLLGLGALTHAAENTKSPAVLLQEAIYQEETAGDLDKAIELYGQVLKEAADTERLAARAAYQLGLCHLKKGDKTAAADFFQTVLNDYPGQTAMVNKAQTQLDKIVPAASKSQQQIIFNDSFEEGDQVPTGWEKGAAVDGVSYIWDKNTGRDGKASLCLKKDVEKYFPIAQWTRKIEYTGNAKELTVSADVRAKNAYKAVIDALFLDDKGEWIKHEWVSYIGAKEAGDPPANHNWKDYRGTVQIPDNTKTIVIGLQLYGPGTVWFDELKVACTDNAANNQQSPPDPLKAENLVAEGWKLWNQRKLAEAEDKFQQAVRSSPNNDGAYQGLGWAQLNQGKKQNAEISFKKCVKLNPDNSAALNGLGWIAYGQDKKPEAVKWWEKAVKAQPGATAALSGLTQTYMETKQYDKAVNYFQMWLNVEPDNQQAKEGLEKAENLLK